MKKSLLLLPFGILALLLSNCTSTTSGLYVVDDTGDPLDGVILEPVALRYGCSDKQHTGPCGHACVQHGQRVNLRRVGYHSVMDVGLDPRHNTYVQMKAIGLGGTDRPYYWTGSSWGYYTK